MTELGNIQAIPTPTMWVSHTLQPPKVITDENGNPITDENGNPIEAAP